MPESNDPNTHTVQIQLPEIKNGIPVSANQQVTISFPNQSLQKSYQHNSIINKPWNVNYQLEKLDYTPDKDYHAPLQESHITIPQDYAKVTENRNQVDINNSNNQAININDKQSTQLKPTLLNSNLQAPKSELSNDSNDTLTPKQNKVPVQFINRLTDTLSGTGSMPLTLPVLSLPTIPIKPQTKTRSNQLTVNEIKSNHKLVPSVPQIEASRNVPTYVDKTKGIVPHSQGNGINNRIPKVSLLRDSTNDIMDDIEDGEISDDEVVVSEGQVQSQPITEISGSTKQTLNQDINRSTTNKRPAQNQLPSGQGKKSKQICTQKLKHNKKQPSVKHSSTKKAEVEVPIPNMKDMQGVNGADYEMRVSIQPSSLLTSSDILSSIFGQKQVTVPEPLNKSLNIEPLNILHPFRNVPNVCHRCGRQSHPTLGCHAKNDINGIPCRTDPIVDLKLEKAKREAEATEKAQKQARLDRERLLESKRKTLPCHAWRDNKCTLGDQCNFSHSGPGSDPRSKQLCQFYRQGGCLKSTSCPFSHDKKSFPCVYFHFKQAAGGCVKGEECDFSHLPVTDEQLMMLKKDQDRFENNQRIQKLSV